MRILMFLIMLLNIAGSCDVRRSLSSAELKAFVLDPGNGLKKSVVGNNDIKLEVIYRPKDLVLELEADGDLDVWLEAEKRLDSLDYFVLQLSRNNQEIENGLAGDPGKFNATIEYLSARINEDISMVSTAVLPVHESFYARSFGAAAATSILFVFKSNSSKQQGKFSIVYDDSFFGSGRSEFVFDFDDIRHTPRLQL